MSTEHPNKQQQQQQRAIAKHVVCGDVDGLAAGAEEKPKCVAHFVDNCFNFRFSICTPIDYAMKTLFIYRKKRNYANHQTSNLCEQCSRTGKESRRETRLYIFFNYYPFVFGLLDD